MFIEVTMLTGKKKLINASHIADVDHEGNIYMARGSFFAVKESYTSIYQKLPKV